MTQTVIQLTIPPRTLPTVPVFIEKSILSGNFTGGSILFPDGCKGLVGVRIYDRDTQVFPDGNNWVTGNGNPPISFKVTHTMEGGNYMVKVEGYNMARDWPHTPQIVLEFT